MQYEPGSPQHYSALELAFDGPIPEAELNAFRAARSERQERIEREAKAAPGSLANKLGLAKRVGLEQRMQREAAE